MIRRALPSLLIFATLVTATVAQAARTDSSAAALLDADAAVVVRLDPGVLFPAAELGAELGGVAGGIVELIRGGSKGLIGADILARKGYNKAGFDVRQPIWMQLAAIDGKRAIEVYERLGKARDWTTLFLRKTPKVMWRTRVVIPLRHRARAKKSLLTLLDQATTMHRLRPTEYERIALLLGDRPKNGKDIIRTLSRYGVIAIGWKSGIDAYVLLRLSKRVAIIEVVGSFAGVPLDWQRDRRKLLRTLVPIARRRGGFRSTLDSGAAHELNSPGAHVWISTKAARAALLALSHTEALRRIAARLPQSKAQARAFRAHTDPDCNGLDTLATRGRIVDVAVSMRLGGKSLQVQASWGLRSTDWLKRLRAKTSNLLAAPSAVLAASVFIHDLKSLTKLWRPAPLQRGLASGLRSLTRCPGGSLTALLITGWPEIAASWLSDLRSVDPMARKIVDNFGPAHAAIRKASIHPNKAVAAMEARVASAAGEVAKAFDIAFGKRAPMGVGKRWGQGPILAFIRGEMAGFAYGKRSLSWFAKLRRSKPPATKGTQLVAARIQPATLLRQIAVDVSSARPWSALAQKHLGPGTASVRVDGDRLRASITVEFH